MWNAAPRDSPRFTGKKSRVEHGGRRCPETRLLVRRGFYCSAVDLTTYSTFTALFALFANVLTIGMLVVLIGARFGNARLSEAREWLRDALRDVGVWLAAAVATASTVGSLLYSEVYDLIPCRLCWYQRVAMYPLALVLITGLALHLARDRHQSAHRLGDEIVSRLV